VKPFIGPQSKRTLSQEIAMFEQLKIFDLDVPEILALVKTGRDYFLVTRFKPEAITLDSLNWEEFTPEERDQNINRALAGLVNIHRRGLFHGDANPRNITIQPNINANWYVDLELGVGAEAPIDILMGIKGDLRSFYEGMSKIFGSAMNFENMTDQVLIPYFIEVLRGSKDSDATHDGIKLIKNLSDLVCNEFRRENFGEPIGPREYLVTAKKLGALSLAR